MSSKYANQYRSQGQSQLSEAKLQGYERGLHHNRPRGSSKIRVNKLFAKHTIGSKNHDGGHGPSIDDNIAVKECEVSSQSTRQLNYRKNSLNPGLNFTHQSNVNSIDNLRHVDGQSFNMINARVTTNDIASPIILTPGKASKTRGRFEIGGGSRPALDSGKGKAAVRHYFQAGNMKYGSNAR